MLILSIGNRKFAALFFGNVETLELFGIVNSRGPSLVCLFVCFIFI